MRRTPDPDARKVTASAADQPGGTTKHRGWVDWVVTGLGLGALLGASAVALMVILFGTENLVESSMTGGKVRFSDIRLPVNTATMVLSLVVVALTVVAVLTRSNTARYTAKLVCLVALLCQALVGLFYFTHAPSMNDADIHGTGYGGTLAAFWVALVGLLLLPFGLAGRAPRTSTTRGVALAAVIALVAAATATAVFAPPTASAEDQMIEIDLGDRHQVSTPLPTAVVGEPRQFADGVVAAYPVGPGFVTVDAAGLYDSPSSLTMYNGDDLTTRWNLRVVGNPSPSIRVHVVTAKGIVAVTVGGFPGGTRSFGIDATTGERIWKNSTTLSLPRANSDRDVEGDPQVHHLLEATDDSTVREYDPTSGQLRWSHDAGTTCSIDDVRDLDDTVELTLTCPDGSHTRVLDANTGAVLPSRPERDARDPDRPPLPEGYHYVADQQDQYPAAIADATGKHVAELTDKRIINCDNASKNCIAEPANRGEIELISLAAPTTPLLFPVEGSYSSSLFLHDQLLIATLSWDGSQPRSASTGQITTVDLRAGTHESRPGRAESMEPFPGGVVMGFDDTLSTMRGTR